MPPPSSFGEEDDASGLERHADLVRRVAGLLIGRAGLETLDARHGHAGGVGDFVRDQPMRPRPSSDLGGYQHGLRSFRRRRGITLAWEGAEFANVVAERLARERRLAAAGGVIERQLLEFVGLGGSIARSL